MIDHRRNRIIPTGLQLSLVPTLWAGPFGSENELMARRKSLRSQLYRAARDLGNVQAARQGPTAYSKRVVRRKVYRTTNGINQRVLREIGL